MGFTATRTPKGGSTPAPTINPFDTGGGVATPPTNGNDLLNLLNDWTYSQTFNGQQTTLTVTPGSPTGIITVPKGGGMPSPGYTPPTPSVVGPSADNITTVAQVVTANTGSQITVLDGWGDTYGTAHSPTGWTSVEVPKPGTSGWEEQYLLLTRTLDIPTSVIRIAIFPVYPAYWSPTDAVYSTVYVFHDPAGNVLTPLSRTEWYTSGVLQGFDFAFPAGTLVHSIEFTGSSDPIPGGQLALDNAAFYVPSVEVTSTSAPVTITQADIDNWNANRNPTDLLVSPGASYDPLKAATTAVLEQYPAQVPTDFVKGATYFKFFHGSSFGRETGYVVFSMNKQFYDYKHGVWTDVMTDYCKIGLYNEWDFLSAINLPFYWSDKPHSIFFATGYSWDGFTKTGVELVVIAQAPAPPAYVELQSGGLFVNFTTGYLDAVRSAATTLQVPWAGADYTDGSTANTWYVCTADMPSGIIAGSTSVTTNLAVAGGNLQQPDIIRMPAGFAPATSSPFALLCQLGVMEVSAPPGGFSTLTGMTELTSPPVQFSRAVLGMTEATSLSAHSLTTMGIISHTGQPFTTQG